MHRVSASRGRILRTGSNFGWFCWIFCRWTKGIFLQLPHVVHTLTSGYGRSHCRSDETNNRSTWRQVSTAPFFRGFGLRPLITRGWRDLLAPTLHSRQCPHDPPQCSVRFTALYQRSVRSRGGKRHPRTKLCWYLASQLVAIDWP